MGWDSKKAGYDGLIEVANRLMMKGTTNSDTVEAAVFAFARYNYTPYIVICNSIFSKLLTLKLVLLSVFGSFKIRKCIR